MNPVIETYTGRLVSLIEPKPEQIEFSDIAWSLSRLARFNGHTQGEHPYSVAQHSVWVAYIAQRYMRADKETTLAALFHDAHEAYMGDITTPLKSVSNLNYHLSDIAVRLQSAIHEALFIPPLDVVRHSIVCDADTYAKAVEARHLMTSTGKDWDIAEDIPDELFKVFWTPMSSHKAYELFWLAYSYIDTDIKLEELWHSV